MANSLSGLPVLEAPLPAYLTTPAPAQAAPKGGTWADRTQRVVPLDGPLPAYMTAYEDALRRSRPPPPLAPPYVDPVTRAIRDATESAYGPGWTLAGATVEAERQAAAGTARAAAEGASKAG